MKVKKYTKIMFLIVVIIASGYISYKVIRLANFYNYASQNIEGKEFLLTFPFTIDENHHYTIPVKISDTILNLKIDNMASAILPERFLKEKGAMFKMKSIIPSIDAYNNINFADLYYFCEIKIDTLPLYKPCFKLGEEGSFINSIMKDGVYGSNLLKIGCWHFNSDENIVTLFNKNNISTLEKRVKHMSCIQKKLNHSRFFNISIVDTEFNYEFGLDLGYTDEIEIDNNGFIELSKKFPYDKIYRLIINNNKTEIDTSYVFDNITIRLDKYTFKNCRIVNMPRINQNFVGSSFMQRLNFILAYMKSEHSSDQRLYFEKSNKEIKYSYISHFDFGIERDLKGEVLVNKIIDRSDILGENIKLGDIIVSINNGDFNLEEPYLADRFYTYAEAHHTLNIKIRRGNNIESLSLFTKQEGE